MSTYVTSRFWILAGERALKTAAQSLVLAWFASGPADLFTLDARTGLGAFLGGAVLSILTSIISTPIGADDTPSLV
jgi:hypothetical protein